MTSVLLIYNPSLRIRVKKIVLVVEDDNDLLMIYKEILELNKFVVHTAVNGKEGVEKFKETQPSLVIMDGDMPVLDGYEAFNQIKKFDNNANVVIVTGMAEYEKKNQEAIKKGLIKVITKPLGIDQLVDLAQKYSEIKLEK
ncbi:Acetoacetate metabolism regulatory protein AtoC [Marine Group I thaumarchaeote SCGC AAA799-D11]|uniref:Acetoacetate metabolism regulatory protein AtoC n=1 Tax=Marine Group I thaumarchaeote SCGC AAA799-D11 TaxID=1502291 RepID=A0A087RVN3_9ARCH|nr:Acetoacetate metabolism regulatory protein AtoC [Marine Group I thaumarchaeote SCGC AAA799-D11]